MATQKKTKKEVYVSEEQMEVMELFDVLKPIKQRYDEINEENKAMYEVMKKSRELMAKRDKIITQEDFQQIKNLVQNVVPFHFTGEDEDNTVHHFLEQIKELYEKRIEEYKRRMPLIENFNKNLKSLTINNKSVKDLAKTNPHWPQRIVDQRVNPKVNLCICPQKANCPKPMSYPCIAFCETFNDKSKITKLGHFALFSAQEGVAVLYYESGQPVTMPYEALTIKETSFLAIDIEFFPDRVTGEQLAARIAVIGHKVRTNPKYKHMSSTVKDLVFHALIRMPKERVFNYQCSSFTDINHWEHSEEKQGTRRTVDAGLAMGYLKNLLTKYPIIWKNFVADMRSLLFIGYQFDPEYEDIEYEFYDMELFYRRDAPLFNHLREQTGWETKPVNLQWLNKYILFDEQSQAEGVPHSPVADAISHLRLFNKIIKVKPFNDRKEITNMSKKERKKSKPKKNENKDIIESVVTSEGNLDKCLITRNNLIDLKNKVDKEISVHTKKVEEWKKKQKIIEEKKNIKKNVYKIEPKK